MSAEGGADRYREYIIAEALSANLPDGVYRIVFHNSQHRRPDEAHLRIDPFTVFNRERPEVVQDWIVRVGKLLNTNGRVGDAVVRRLPDRPGIEAQYRKDNPGFSERTYSHAIHLGASMAVF